MHPESVTVSISNQCSADISESQPMSGIAATLKKLFMAITLPFLYKMCLISRRI